MIHRIKAIIRKEIRHILRDPRTLSIVFVMPVMMVFMYGYALNMDVREISLGIIDRDRTPDSRELIRTFAASRYFDVLQISQDARELEKIFAFENIRTALIIPKGFGNERQSGTGGEVQLIVDGSEPSYGHAAVNYSNAVIQLFAQKDINMPSIQISENFLYNPELRGADFVIPGIVAIILMMVCALLISLTVAKEKETGTMDILLVSPVRPFEIISGKIIPYIFLAFLEALLILLFSQLVFGLPFRGSFLLLFILTAVYIFSSLGIGLFISSMASSQQVAMMAALVATIMPSMVLSGFIFSIFSMPSFIRPITMLIPARHYITILRGILLKGSTFSSLATETFLMGTLGIVFVALAIFRFSRGVGK